MDDVDWEYSILKSCKTNEMRAIRPNDYHFSRERSEKKCIKKRRTHKIAAQASLQLLKCEPTLRNPGSSTTLFRCTSHGR